MNELEISRNRADRKYPLDIQLLRVLWAVGRILFRLVPRPFYAPRRMLLRCFGAKIGRQVNVSNTAVVYFPWNLEIGDWSSIGEWAVIYNLGKVVIGERATISQQAHLCAGSHDFRDPSMPLLTPPITVGDQVWVCADAFIGPNVSIGEGAVIGARAMIRKNVDPWSIMAGNPASVVGTREFWKQGSE